MHVTVLGATGRSGSLVTRLCAIRGHDVTASARRPEAVEAPEGVSVLPLDLTNFKSVRNVVRGADVVVSALGHGGGLFDARRGTNLYSSSARTLVSALREEGVKRIIMMGSAGVEEDDTAPWIFNIIFRRYVMNLYLDMARMETILEDAAPEIESTVVRIPFLYGDSSASFIVGDGKVGRSQHKISYPDLARFVADEIDAREWVGRKPVPAYPK